MTEGTEFVTSMSRAYFERCGRDMVASFMKFVDPAVRMRVYHEASAEKAGPMPGYDLPDAAGRLVAEDLLERTAYAAFAAEARPRVEAKIGPVSPDPDRRRASRAYDYRWDALTFGKKAFALVHAVTESRTRRLFWVDADVVFRRALPVSVLEGLFRGAGIVYYGRKKQHSETGFFGVDRTAVGAEAFLADFALFWGTRKVLGMEEGWTDSHVFDRALSMHPELARTNLSAQPEGHVVAASPFGSYIDHRKGPRKNLPKSPEAR